MACAALLGLLWWTWGGAEADTPSQAMGPSPTESWLKRGGARPASLNPASSEEEPEDDEDAPLLVSEVMVVWLRDATEGFLTYPKRGHLRPSEFWPLEGQAPFPQGETAPGLQALIQQDLAHDAPEVLDWLDLALEEGVDPETLPVDEPWSAVLALEVARREALATQALDYQQARQSSGMSPYGQATPRSLVGPPDLDLVQTLATDLIDAHPEHPASEFGRLYLLDAIHTGGDASVEARDIAVDLLRHTDDALVVSQSIDLLTTLPRGEPLGPGDLDTLAQFAQDFPELVDPLIVSTFALDHAMRQDDARRTRHWLQRLERALEAECAGERANGGTCRMHIDNRDEIVAYLGDVHPSEAANWKQAFEIAGYACARQGHDWSMAPMRTRATWNGTWSWEAWSVPDNAYTRCFEQAATSGPDPQHERLEVRLNVVR